MKRKLVFGFFALVSFPAGLWAAAFEPLGHGAAAKAMGGAFVALAEDGSASYWNPAGLSLVKKPEFNASTEDLNGLGLLRYNTVGYTHPNIGKGTLSAQLLHLGTGGDAKFYNYAESTYLLAYGRSFCEDCVSLGVGMRYYSAYGEGTKGTALGFDVGVLARLFNDHLRLASSVQDLNRPRVDWSTGARDYLPYTSRTGVAFRSDGGLDTTLQYDKTSTFQGVWRAGVAQRLFNDLLTLRVGTHRAGEQDQWGMSMGGGFRFKAIGVDYAWDSHEDLGNTQTFSLNVRFGK